MFKNDIFLSLNFPNNQPISFLVSPDHFFSGTDAIFFINLFSRSQTNVRLSLDIFSDLSERI